MKLTADPLTLAVALGLLGPAALSPSERDDRRRECEEGCACDPERVERLSEDPFAMGEDDDASLFSDLSISVDELLHDAMGQRTF
ncbi:hypothetical protein L6R49_08755 [Myxococcota bacterium]|nr:hypothetical protein [Myxococcota bacterium]